MGKPCWKRRAVALKSIGIAALMLAAEPLAAEPAELAERWSGLVAEASARFGIPEGWIRRVMRAESGGRTMLGGQPITSRAGAMGLMQLMPGTWREMRDAHQLGAHPHDPRDNIFAGTAYLRAMYDRFGYPGLFAAYNAGPARYARHLATGRRLPAETVAYVAAVSGIRSGPVRTRTHIRSSGVFVKTKGASHSEMTSQRTQTLSLPAIGSLFVRLATVPEVAD